jgi:hypothetical protein
LTEDPLTIYRADAKLTNAGTLTLLPGSTAIYTGVEGDDIGIEQISYGGYSGRTFLYGGSVLTTTVFKTVMFSSGIVATVSDDMQGLGSGNCSAAIGGSTVQFAGADIYINYGAAAHSSFGTLTIGGNCVWSGGTYHPC